MEKVFDILYVVSIIQIICISVTFCQDGLVFCAIVPATTSLMARIARTNASALTMLPATRKMVRQLNSDPIDSTSQIELMKFYTDIVKKENVQRIRDEIL